MGEGVLKTKFLEEMYENKLEFPGGGRGCKTKTFHGGGVWLFSGTAHCIKKPIPFLSPCYKSCTGYLVVL